MSIRAKKLQPENTEVLLGFGRVCLKMDLLEDAEPALARAAQLRSPATRSVSTRLRPRGSGRNNLKVPGQS